MSALDLFASAMGAFILIMLILMPYYLNKSRPLLEKIEDLKQKNASLAQQLKECRSKQNTCQSQLSKTRRQLASATDALKKAQKQNGQLKQNLQSCVRKNSSCQKRLENSIKFALLGLSTRAESFVIVVDMSGSMKSYTALMKNTMRRILKPMKGHNRIQIIGYQGKSNNPQIHRWLSTGQLRGMDPGGKAAAMQYTDGLALRFGDLTPTHAALMEALRYPAQAIVLLTDGSPNTNPSVIIQDITRRNAGRMEIHTVAIGEYWSNRKMVRFLSELAKRNRGDFTGVAATQ